MHMHPSFYQWPYTGPTPLQRALRPLVPERALNDDPAGACPCRCPRRRLPLPLPPPAPAPAVAEHRTPHATSKDDWPAPLGGWRPQPAPCRAQERPRRARRWPLGRGRPRRRRPAHDGAVAVGRSAEPDMDTDAVYAEVYSFRQAGRRSEVCGVEREEKSADVCEGL